MQTLFVIQVAKIQEIVHCRHQERPRSGTLLMMTSQSLWKLMQRIGTNAAPDSFRQVKIMEIQAEEGRMFNLSLFDNCLDYVRHCENTSFYYSDIALDYV